MTNEEVIKILTDGAWWDDLNPNMSDADETPLHEALDAAIAALRAQQAPPPNAPLALDELREMDGNPVWVVDGAYGCWMIITDIFSKALWAIHSEDEGEVEMPFEDYGKTWWAYRRKPEENAKIDPAAKEFERRILEGQP